MDDIRTRLSYRDVLFVLKRSPVDSRSDINLATAFTPTIELDTPLISAATDTVTEVDLAVELTQAGGFGVLHRFLPSEEQSDQVKQVSDEWTGQRCNWINKDYVT